MWGNSYKVENGFFVSKKWIVADIKNIGFLLIDNVEKKAFGK